MTEKDIILALLGVLIAGGGWFARTVLAELRVISSTREECVREFANASENTRDHRRIWEKAGEHSLAIARHTEQIDALKTSIMRDGK